MQILIALDGSSGSEAALSDLKRAGLPPRVEAVVLSVADAIPPSSDENIDQPTQQLVVDYIEKARARAMEAVEQARAIAVHGSTLHRAAFLIGPCTRTLSRTPRRGVS